ncbi:MAG: hypothetical protein H0T89_35115 [Deltaproteobacteria bacterium]|nr:hypothetical protein [Deltaproteobacteria bacterium]MDQ3300627.1 hypothetical protein [Myxococcota bacterium]
MNRIRFALVTTLVAGAFGCQADNKGTNQKLDEISQRLAAIENKIGSAPVAGAAAPRAQQPQRAAPNPSAVYAIPIGESAVIGPKHAKVTIIEAFTFT